VTRAGFSIAPLKQEWRRRATPAGQRLLDGIERELAARRKKS
jgi:hypothetical protein